MGRYDDNARAAGYGLAILLTFAVGVASAPAFAVDILIKYDGIDGDSDIEGYEDFTAIDSFVLPVSAVVNEGSVGSGRGQATVIFGDAVVSQEAGMSYPLLFSRISRSETISKVFVDFLTSGKGPQKVPFFQVEFEDVFLTSLLFTGNAGTQPRLDTTFAFDKITVRYEGFDEDGKQGPKQEASYDLTDTAKAAQVAELLALGFADPGNAVVPVPAAVWGFGAALVALGGWTRRRR